MRTLAEQCTELCQSTQGDSIKPAQKRTRIAKELAKLLIDSGDVNTMWDFNTPDDGKEDITSYLQYMDDDLIGQLLKKGLNLNQQHSNGVRPFTWFIGNAQNDLVDELWLKIFPVTIGEGKKLFDGGAIPAAFELVECKPTPSGVIIASYKRAGEVKTGSF